MQKTQREVLEIVKSDSRLDVHYEITVGEDAVVYCTCLGWKYHKKCKHLTRFSENHPQVMEHYRRLQELDFAVDS